MKFDLKELIVFFVVFVIGSWIGNWVNSMFNLQPNDMLSTILVMFVPVLIIYLLWKNFGEKAAAT
ncbi:hypothetical protein DRO19_00170 [Candidatus Bathyarchaeota archaeon]|nr:MAG: hypothetical protein DRO19_00170 [Candidatus Bathyarchaeota archaeon]